LEDIRTDGGNVPATTGNYFNPGYNIDYDWVRRVYTKFDTGSPSVLGNFPF